jgi:predicted TIM-barrel fold metal-dependent hydrolase
MEIIDAHTNLRHPGEVSPNEYNLWPTFEDYLAVLREAGVAKAVAYGNWSAEDTGYDDFLARNRRIADSCAQSGGLLLPAAHVSPDSGEATRDLLRHCREEFDMRFLGELFDRRRGFTWGTPEYWRLLEYAAELRMLPLIHCENECLPELGERATGPVLLAHFMDDIEARVETMLRYPNQYLVISGGEIDRIHELRWAICTLGADRVLFGSDIGACDPVISALCVRRARLTEEQQAMVFAGTFHKLWAWTEGQT